MTFVSTWTGDEIKALREKHGLSQKAWATVLGFKRWQTVSELENGHADPTEQTETLLDYIETFGILPPRESD